MHRRTHFGLFAVFVMLLVVGALSLQALRVATKSRGWVSHSHRVMSHLANLSWAIDEVQASVRAYSSNGNDAYLRAAMAARLRADAERSILLDLTADDTAQQRSLSALAGLARPLPFEQLKTVANGSLAGQFEAFGVVPHVMQQRESGLLQERQKQLSRSFGWVNAAVGSGMAVGFAFYLLATLYARRDYAAAERARAENEERMRVLVNGVHDYAIFMLDPDGRIVSWNAGARRIKGYEAAEIVGRNFSCFYSQADIDAGLPEQELKIAASGGRVEVERWRLRKDGTRFLASIVITAARDEDGRLIGFSEISRDLSERKETEARYRGLLEAAPDAMLVVDEGGKILVLNMQAEKQFGYRRDELLGQQVTNIIPEGFAERIIADGTRTAAEALAQQIGTGIELTARRKDGTEFPIEIMLSPLESKDGVLVTAAIRDITVRKHEEARYRGLLEAAPDAMVVVDENGKIVLLNAQAEKQFGYRRDELLSQKVTAIIPHGFAERLIADGTRTSAEALAQQIGTGIELVARRKDGSEFPIEIMLSPLESAEGILVTAAIRDISVRRGAEANLEEVESRYRVLLEGANPNSPEIPR